MTAAVLTRPLLGARTAYLEREAIYQTMEHYKVIARTPGDEPLHAEKSEGIL
jgi:hypothetical protein